MKKRYLLLSLVLLSSCSSKVDTSGLKIVTPTGAPAFAFYNHASSSNFETNSTPSNIVAMMNDKSDKDIVVIDTVTGIKAIQKGAPYLLAANITLGNFYIASTGNDDNNVMDEDDKIVLFGEKQTPDLVFHYIYGDVFDKNIEYVTNVQDAAKCLASGKNLVTGSSIDYVFVAQPVLYTILNNKNAATYSKAGIYENIQDKYKEKSDNLSLIQASVFVKNSDESEYNKTISAFLKDLKSDITSVISNPNLMDNTIGKLETEVATSLYGTNYQMVKKVIEDDNSLGLGYIKAIDNKKAIDNFISLFGMDKTNEEIYFK